MPTTRHLTRPGVRLRYDVRGSGPLLVLTGAPMAGMYFAPLADALADGYTVVTHDPRGISGSVLDDPGQDSTPELRADDLAAILDDLGAEDADVFGSSGGAVTGLALVARHPRRVRTLVAHEPPVVELLPDVVAQRAAVDDIVEAFHRDGLEAAFGTFMAHVGWEQDDPAGPPGEPSEQDLADSVRFFSHELRATTRHVPDIAALRDGPAQVVVGIGAESGHLLTYRTSMALANRLGTAPVEFPGEHGGFMDRTAEFAEVLRKTLAVSS